MDLEKAKLDFAHAGNEAAILSCVLKNAANYYEVDSRLAEGDFLKSHHRALWNVIRALIRQNVVSLDTTAILNQATTMKLEETIGGYDYVSALFDKMVDPSNIDFYLTRVADASSKLKVVRALNDISELVDKNKTLSGDTLPAEAIIDAAQNKFLQISLEAKKTEDALNIADGIDALLEEVCNQSGTSLGLSTGFSRLDDAINGLESGTLTVVGARPKTGKSTILMNWAQHIAYTQGAPVLYLDTEMSTREQQFRLLSILSGVPEKTIKRGQYKDNTVDLEHIDEAKRILNSGLILHKYFPGFTAETLASVARKYQYQHNIGCIIFDYIKLAGDDLDKLRNVREDQSLGYLTSALKNLAGELKIPVIAAAQIGRVGANKGRLGSADFADSDRILRYANTLLGFSTKTKQDLKDAEEKFGREVVKDMGTHRLQILNTRAGGDNFTGIDIYFRREILTMREAPQQETGLLKAQGDDNDVE